MATYRDVKKDAELAYVAFWQSSVVRETALMRLVCGEDDTSARMRGALIGRDGPATWSEVVQLRLVFDVQSKKLPYAPVLFDASTVDDGNEGEHAMRLADVVLKSFPANFRDALSRTEKREIPISLLKELFGYNYKTRTWSSRVGDDDCRGLVWHPRTINFQRRVFEKCHDIYKKTGKVTIDDARTAFDITLRCKQPELSLLMNHPTFNKDINSFFEADYIDKTFRNRCETSRTSKKSKSSLASVKFAMREDDPGHPIVQDIVLVDKTDDTEYRYKVIHYPFSPQFMGDLMTYINSEMFIAGEGGRESSNIRVVSNPCEADVPGAGSHFITGKVKVNVYPSSGTRNDMEDTMLGCADMILQEMYTILRRVHPDVNIPDTMHVNTMQMLIGFINKAIYSAHNDGTPLINLVVTLDGANGKVEVTDGTYLPTLSNLVILTFTATNDEMVDSCFLHIRKKDKESYRNIGKVPLSNMCFHMQLAGTNKEGLTHQVCSRSKSNAFRISITCRYAVDPSLVGKEVYEERLSKCFENNNCSVTRRDFRAYRGAKSKSNVLTDLLNPLSNRTYLDSARNDDGGDVDDDSVEGDSEDITLSAEQDGNGQDDAGPEDDVADGTTPETAAIDYRQHIHNDHFGQVNDNDYRLMFGSRYGSHVRLAGRAWKHAVSPPCILYLYRKKCLVDLIRRDIDDIPRPILQEIWLEDPKDDELFNRISRLYVPGMKVKLGYLAGEAKMIHTFRAHPVTGNSRCAIVVISVPYKNDRQRIEAILQRIIAWRENQDEPLFDAFEELFHICGCGGMPSNSGSHAPNVAKVTKDQALLEIQVGQSFDSIKNQKFMTMFEEGTPFALFVNESRFYGKKVRESDEDCTFIAYSFFSSLTVTRDDVNKFTHDMASLNATPDYIKKSVFRLSRYFKFNVSSIFAKEDINKQKEDGRTSEMTRFVVDTKDSTAIVSSVTASEVKNGSATRDSVLEKLWNEKIMKAVPKAESSVQHFVTFGSFIGGEVEPNCSDINGLIVDKKVSKVQPAGRRGRARSNLARISSEEENSVEDEDVEEFEGLIDASRDAGIDTEAAKKLLRILKILPDEDTDEQGGAIDDDDDAAEAKEDEADETNEGDLGEQERTRGEASETAFDGDVVVEPNSSGKTKATIADIWNVSVNVNQAGARRFVGDSVVDSTFQEELNILRQNNEVEGSSEQGAKPKDYVKHSEASDDIVGPNASFMKPGQYATPLHGDSAKYMNQSAKQRASPMATPEFDQNVNFIMEEMERRGFERPRFGTVDISTIPKDREGMCDFIFESLYSTILFRVTGRAEAFRQVAWRTKHPNYIPKSGVQVREWIRCVERDIEQFGGKKYNPFNYFLSKQHDNSIPAEWRKWDGFKLFLLALESSLRTAVESFYDDNVDGGCLGRNFISVVDMVERVLDGLRDCKKTNIRWFSQQTVLDLYPVFGDIFGNVRSVDITYGFGSKTCVELLRNNGLFKASGNKNVAAAGDDPSQGTNPGDPMQVSFSAALDALIKYVNEEVPDECLAACGMFKKNGVVFLKINGVKYGARHAEHAFCKFYLMCKYTWPNFRISEKPEASAHHCWPQKWTQDHCDSLTQTTKDLKTVLVDMMIDFKKIMSGSDVTLKRHIVWPEVVLLNGEEVDGYDTITTSLY